MENFTVASKVSPKLHNVFLDVDDVILNSSHIIIDILNERYNQNQSIEDLTDWGYRSLFPQVTDEETEEIFASEEFWQRVEIVPTFREWILEDQHNLLSNYNWIYVTKGGKNNLIQKKRFLDNLNPNKAKDFFAYYGLNLSENKSDVHMWGGIQIDDNWDNLKDTDAEVKILIKNFRETEYNTIGEESTLYENVYMVDTLEEAFQILQFIAQMNNSNNQDFFSDIQTEFNEELLSIEELRENEEI